ncbi:tetratricopeptide repeat protein [Crateriforma conspicua]|uniref:tetratricopeptide repeat protein n=1 Tax=Crateriforma conspicua TaxID=2527996 RepID=UPI001189DA01|nr:tetratricopeptide repeat protein [Crateriforma conspicua]QDV65143.1 Tetratricopeptide repeat protein [Crateriforma conspicua]
MKRTVNTKAALILLIAVTSVSAIAVGLHYFQKGRSAELFLSAARESAEEADVEGAIRSYKSYLKLRADDNEARKEFGQYLFDLELYGTASEELEHALRLEPDATESRRLAARCAMLTGRATDADEHIHRIEEYGQDAELLDWLAQCSQYRSEPEEAERLFRSSIAIDPNQAEVHFRLANLLSRVMDRPTEADDVMEEMISANADSTIAHRLYSQYLLSRSSHARSIGEEEDAIELVSRSLKEAENAVELDQEDSDSLVLLANAHLLAGNPGAAKKAALSAQTLSPSDPRSTLLLAELEVRADEIDKAIEWLTDGIREIGDTPATVPLYGSLAGIYLDQQRLEDAELAIAQMQSHGAAPAMLGYLQGRVAAAKGQWLDAVKQLKLVRPSLVGNLQVLRQLDFVLGTGHEILGQPELAMSAFRRSIESAPDWIAPRFALVRVLEASGQLEKAYAEMVDLMALPSAPREGLIQLGRLALAINSRRPFAERDWATTEQIVHRAVAELGDTPDVAVLKSQLLIAQGHTDTASKLLEDHSSNAAAGSDDTSWTLLLAKSRLAQGQSNWETAQSLIDQAEMKLGMSADLIIERALLIARRDGSDGVSTIQDIAQNATGLDGEDQVRVAERLSAIVRDLGDSSTALQMVRPYLEEHPERVSVWQLAFELALSENDRLLQTQSLDRIRAIQGESSLWHYFSAVKDWSAVKGKEQEFDQRKIFAHLDSAEEMRPGWGLPAVLRAEILLDQGDDDLGITQLVSAIENGVRSKAVVQKAVASLYQRRELEEANRILNLVDTADPELGRLSSVVSLGLEDTERGLEKARKAAEASDSFEDHLWYGRVAFATAQTMGADEKSNVDRNALLLEAKNAFRRACEINPENPQSWISLIDIVRRQEQPEDLAKLSQKAIEAVAEADQAALRAQIQWMTGKDSQAENTYDELISSPNPNPAVLRKASEFYLSKSLFEKAKNALTVLTSTDGTSEQELFWARRQIALMSLMRPEMVKNENALSLIEKNLDEAGPNSSDLRVKARLLANSPETQVQDLVSAWEAVTESSQGRTASDYSSLAFARMKSGNLQGALAEQRSAIAAAQTTGERNRMVTQYAGWLLDQNQLSEAEIWLENLEDESEASKATHLIRADLAARKGDHTRATELLTDILNTITKDGDSDSAGATAAVLTQVGQAAERIANRVDSDARSRYTKVVTAAFQRATDLNASARFYLASSLLHQNNIDAAITQLERTPVQEAELGLAIRALDTLAVSKQLNEKQLERLEILTQSLIEDFGQRSSLQMVRASLAKSKGDVDQASKIYRDVLGSDEQNLIALNNLAVLLSESDGSLAEAANLSDLTIQIAGRMPALLDTRAVIAIASKENQVALELLNEATQKEPNAMFLFHRAVAQLKAGNQDLANADFQKAIAIGLESDQFGKRELGWFQMLQK